MKVLGLNLLVGFCFEVDRELRESYNHIVESVDEYLFTPILPDGDVELTQDSVPRLVLTHHLLVGDAQLADAHRAEGPEVLIADEPVSLRVVLDPLGENLVELVFFARSLVRREDFHVGRHHRRNEKVEENHLE